MLAKGIHETPEVPNDSTESSLVLCCSLCLQGSWVEVTRAGTVSRAASRAPASVTVVLLTENIRFRVFQTLKMCLRN